MSSSSERLVYADTRTPFRKNAREILSREWAFRDGHFALFVFGCVFSANVVFWVVNGVIDFGSAFALGAITQPQQVITKGLAYLLLIPTFLVVQIGYYMTFHREQFLAGQCPSNKIVTLDWFAVGILAVSFPMAFQNLGAWIVSTLIYGMALFVIPRYLDKRRHRDIVRIGGLLVGFALYVYIVHGHTLLGLPPATETLGPALAFTLDQEVVQSMLRITNSITIGPILVGLFAIANNFILTSDAVYSIPVIRASVPERQSLLVVFNSAAIGTIFFLVIKGLYIGEFILIP